MPRERRSEKRCWGYLDVDGRHFVCREPGCEVHSHPVAILPGVAPSSESERKTWVQMMLPYAPPNLTAR